LANILKREIKSSKTYFLANNIQPAKDVLLMEAYGDIKVKC